MSASKILLFSLLSYVYAENYATYPQVPKTATINGFADMVYDTLPSCAQECVKFATDNTPCPYWDTGCLCVMAQWNDEVASCIAESCSGSDVNSATSVANSVCSSVGANTWMLYSSDYSILSEAAAKEQTATTTDADSSTSDSSNSDSTISDSSSVEKTSSSTKETSSSMEVTSSAQKSTTVTSSIGSSSSQMNSTESTNDASPIAIAKSADLLISTSLFAAIILLVSTFV